MENKIQKTKVEEKKDNLSSKDKYNIVLKLYKALADNLEELKSKSNDKKQVTKVSQLAYMNHGLKSNHLFSICYCFALP